MAKTSTVKRRKNGTAPKLVEEVHDSPVSNIRSRIDYLRAGRIKAHPDYQRPLDRGAVQRIISDFDADAFGLPFILEDSTGSLWAIDGQTRIAAVVEMYGPETEIECEIVSNMTLARAAQLFRKRNNSRQVTSLDKFLAGVTAGDPECVAINEVVRSVGLTVARSGGDAVGVVRVVTALKKVYNMSNVRGSTTRPELLRQTLAILKEAWGPHTTTFSAPAIEGLAMVLERYPKEIKVLELTNKLKSFPGGATRMVAAGKALRDSLGGSTALGVALSIVHRYNSSRRVGKLPDWRSGLAGTTRG